MGRRTSVNFQAAIYSLLPGFLQQPINVLRVMPSFVHWWFNPAGRKHATTVMMRLKDHFRGCRCVVIGNGPSLRQMDLSVLRDEYTFGLNRFYLMFGELGFHPDFLVAVNGFVMRQFRDEIQDISSLKILNWKHREGYRVDASTVFLSSKPGFQMDGKLMNGYYLGGGTVTNVALEAAYYLGFSEVVLIGVDHSYREQGMAGKPVISKRDDEDHFHPDYFGKGVVWQLPNYSAMERGYREAKGLFTSNSRRIVDATLDGKLEIFPKADFKSYLEHSEYRSKRPRATKQ